MGGSAVCPSSITAARDGVGRPMMVTTSEPSREDPMEGAGLFDFAKHLAGSGRTWQMLEH